MRILSMILMLPLVLIMEVYLGLLALPVMILAIAAVPLVVLAARAARAKPLELASRPRARTPSRSSAFVNWSSARSWGL